MDEQAFHPNRRPFHTLLSRLRTHVIGVSANEKLLTQRISRRMLLKVSTVAAALSRFGSLPWFSKRLAYAAPARSGSADGSIYAYIVDSAINATPYIWVVDTTTHSIVDTIAAETIDGELYSVAVTPGGDRVYIADIKNSSN